MKNSPYYSVENSKWGIKLATLLLQIKFAQTFDTILGWANVPFMPTKKDNSLRPLAFSLLCDQKLPYFSYIIKTENYSVAICIFSPLYYIEIIDFAGMSKVKIHYLPHLNKFYLSVLFCKYELFKKVSISPLKWLKTDKNDEI